MSWMNPPYSSPSGVPGSTLIDAVTNAWPPAGTVTCGEENVTVSSNASKLNEFGHAELVPNGLIAVLDVRLYVTGVEPELLIVRICEPPRPSPSAILRGETVAVAAIERSTLIRPAPSRSGDSKMPAPGLPLHSVGSA